MSDRVRDGAEGPGRGVGMSFTLNHFLLFTVIYLTLYKRACWIVIIKFSASYTFKSHLYSNLLFQCTPQGVFKCILIFGLVKRLPFILRLQVPLGAIVQESRGTQRTTLEAPNKSMKKGRRLHIQRLVVITVYFTGLIYPYIRLWNFYISL
jgi:hypothetical protein